MSPEQASGKPLDFRSDQFALGSIFYEMATGKRAFQRGTTAETLTAIIREEPEPVARITPHVPAPFRWIVERCLQKDPEERYASTRDLARDIARRARAPVGGLAVGFDRRSAAPPRRRGRRLALARAVLAAAALAAVFVAGRLRAPPPAARRPPSNRSRSAAARSCRPLRARRANDRLQRRLGREPSQALPETSVEPGGPAARASERESPVDLLLRELAIDVDCRNTHPSTCAGTLARAALTGGAPRDVAESIQDADWASDATNLLVVRDVAGKARIEFPIGKVLYETSGYISDARLSRDNKRIAFLDHPFPQDDSGVVAVIDLQGNKKELTPRWNKAVGLAWSPSGDEVWFTATDTGANLSLYSVSLRGRCGSSCACPEGSAFTTSPATAACCSTRGGPRVATLGMLPGDSRERDLSWSRLLLRRRHLGGRQAASLRRGGRGRRRELHRLSAEGRNSRWSSSGTGRARALARHPVGARRCAFADSP